MWHSVVSENRDCRSKRDNRLHRCRNGNGRTEPARYGEIGQSVGATLLTPSAMLYPSARAVARHEWKMSQHGEPGCSFNTAGRACGRRCLRAACACVEMVDAMALIPYMLEAFMARKDWRSVSMDALYFLQDRMRLIRQYGGTARQQGYKKERSRGGALHSSV